MQAAAAEISAAAGFSALDLDDAHLRERIVRLRRHNIGDERHVRLVKPLCRSRDRHADRVVMDVGHAVRVALGNDEALDLRFAERG